jgi:KaiC/GvpD/RAD55 family RecA-like ATPase
MDDLDTAPKRDYLVKGLISPAEISLWVGPPKCAKTFLLLDIAYRLLSPSTERDVLSGFSDHGA